MTLFLLSDFGLRDSYVGQMKSTVLNRCGAPVQMVDLSHDIPAGSIRQGAWLLMTSFPHLTPGSVVLAVVDPGVGSHRRAVAVESGEITLVGPDNGLFGWLSADRLFDLPKELTGSSNTFHGRDLFAPVAAEILVDPGWTENLEEVPVDTLVQLEKGRTARSGRVLETSVAHVDVFGNVVLWMTPDDAAGFIPASATSLPGPTARLVPARKYTDGKDGVLMLLEGSQGFMELAVDSGSAASLLDVSTGDRITLQGTFH